MKKLILLRHGKAEAYDAKPDDFDRVLAERGRLNAAAIGNYILKKSGVPELILSSSAKRTMETASLAAKEMGYAVGEIHADKNLYLASARRILLIINNLSDNYNSCLIVGHNPGLTELINQLNVRLDNLPTGSAACFIFNCDTWHEISPKNTRFQWIQFVRELKVES